MAGLVECEASFAAWLALERGLAPNTLEFDSANHCVKMRYDSMQIAKKNIEMTIAKVGYVANGVTPESIGAKPKDK